MRRILLFGNSNLVAVADAAERLQGRESRNGADPIWTAARLHASTADLTDASGDPVRLGFILIGAWAQPLLATSEPELDRPGEEVQHHLDAIVEALAGPVDQVVSYLGGAEPSIFSLVEHPQPFDVIVDASDPGLPADGPPRQIIPREIIERVLSEWIATHLRYARMLQRVFPGTPMVHLLPPPPMGDDDEVRARAEIFAAAAESHGVAPAALRRKVYDIYTQTVADMFEGEGIRVLPLPAAAVEDGYLAPGLWLKATHANDRYGRLVLEQLGI